MNAGLTVEAPAKLNLYVHVIGRRPDGYHLLDSLIAFAGLADRITLRDSATGGLALSGPFAAGLTAGEDNLALRAARALAARALPERGGGVRIALEKNIPVAAGLGGGSADAAAVLAGLAALWGTGEAALGGIAAGLGADVPACLAGRPTFVAGIGEVLGPAVALPEAGLVLVNPGLALETAAVFRAYDDSGAARRAGPARPRPVLDPPPGSAAALAEALEETGNDLTQAALGLAPALGDVLAELCALAPCRLARMTGSGPTCFGLFDDVAAAQDASETLKRKASQWWCRAGPLAAPDTPTQGRRL